ncbi:hypothetical protein [Actinomadura oligospora]|uniref:hypothetical protein n=1 Tax=Actinomadura oligospora TaxID=111804 RepID=UPI00047C3250|nr:hypothetical protein [Actinomadura oligospora]
MRILWAGDNRPRLIYTGSPDTKYEVYVIGGPSPGDPGNSRLRDYVDRFMKEEEKRVTKKHSTD